MNTLSKHITARFFTNEDGYSALVARWSALMQDKEARKSLYASHHLLYLILRGKNWHKAFTAPTNRKKLENGARPSATGVALSLHGGHYDAVMMALFPGILAEDAMKQVRVLLPKCGYYEDALKSSPYNAPAVELEAAA